MLTSSQVALFLCYILSVAQRINYVINFTICLCASGISIAVDSQWGIATTACAACAALPRSSAEGQIDFWMSRFFKYTSNDI